MRHKLISQAAERTYAVIMESGDEAISNLQAFCEQQDIGAARFSAIGAFSSAVLGYFNWDSKDYDKIPLREQVEVLSLAGDVALHEGRPKIHAHVVLGKRDGSAHGGHLLEAYVRPTLEVMLIESPRHLRRTMDAESGLPLIDIAASGPD
ncbi:MAG TPA: PPC domain-containing DNA-binding protein [Noviherbaspirillum sp.]|nr:PPC domain-containing DNA-binding protein [Noviherbaspirillum sp.]